jgi:hypothetical protein
LHWFSHSPSTEIAAFCPTESCDILANMKTLKALFGSLLLIAGCGGGSNSTDGPAAGDMSKASAADMTTMAMPDMATSSTGDGGGMFTLKLENYISWCALTVNNNAVPIMDVQTLQFAPNTVVNLSGDKKNATFVWGYWVGTTGDVGPSHDTMMMTTVKMDSDKTVQACCPFANMPNVPCAAPN